MVVAMYKATKFIQFAAGKTVRFGQVWIRLLLDNGVTLFITIKKSVHENSPILSTKSLPPSSETVTSLFARVPNGLTKYLSRAGLEYRMLSFKDNIKQSKLFLVPNNFSQSYFRQVLHNERGRKLTLLLKLSYLETEK